MRNPSPELTGPIALALARSRDRKRWSVAAAQATTSGRTHVEVGFFQESTAAGVVAYLLSVLERSDPVALVMDAHDPGKPIVPLLVAAEIEPELTNASQFAEACGGFLDDATNDLLSHVGQQILADSVSDAQKRELPKGDFVWDDAVGDSAAPLKAVTLARWALLTFGARAAQRPARPSRGTRRADRGQATRERDLLTMAF